MGSSNVSAYETRLKQAQYNVEACKRNLANARAQKASKGQIENLKANLKYRQDALKQAREDLKRAKASAKKKK